MSLRLQRGKEGYMGVYREIDMEETLEMEKANVTGRDVKVQRGELGGRV